MTNEQVIEAWLNGNAAKAGNLSTDGTSLYSYAVEIGDTVPSGKKVVYDYTSGGSYGWVSQTTSRHVGLAKRFA